MKISWLFVQFAHVDLLISISKPAFDENHVPGNVSIDLFPPSPHWEKQGICCFEHWTNMSCLFDIVSLNLYPYIRTNIRVCMLMICRHEAKRAQISLYLNLFSLRLIDSVWPRINRMMDGLRWWIHHRDWSCCSLAKFHAFLPHTNQILFILNPTTYHNICALKLQRLPDRMRRNQ